jgi:hypothetical protein
LDFCCWPSGIPLEGITKLNGTEVVTFHGFVGVALLICWAPTWAIGPVRIPLGNRTEEILDA